MAQGPSDEILVTIWITIRIQESEVRNPDSLHYRKSYHWILMKVYGELGCGLETNVLHFGDDPYHYPDPRVRFGSRSGSGKNWRSVRARFDFSRSTDRILMSFDVDIQHLCQHRTYSCNFLTGALIGQMNCSNYCSQVN